MVPSKYQQKISKEYLSTNNNILVNAVPGSGKTTTIIQLLNLTPEYKKSCYLAFNKSIVDDLKNKLKHKSNILISTLHSIGLSTIYQNTRSNINIDYYKTINRFFELNDKLWKENDKRLAFSAYIVSDLYDCYRLNNCKSIKELTKYANQMNIEYIESDLQKVSDIIFELEKYNNTIISKSRVKKNIDFLDMVYLPIKLNLKSKKYDELFIDECQDLSIIQQELIKKLLSKNGRFVAVGDRNQSIYAFIGADKNSFDNFLTFPNTKQLPLSISYRCKENIANFANLVYDTIETLNIEEKGEVKYDTIDNISNGDFVLCRNNAPLVDLFIELLPKKLKVVIKGKDLGNQLLSILKPLKESDDKDDYLNSILKKLENDLINLGVTEPKRTNKYRTLLEKVSIIKILSKNFDSLFELRKILKDLYVESNSIKDLSKVVLLSTIHKAKGLEAENVFILAPELIPSPYAESSLELEQEENLKYVAYTRAKNNLIFIKDFKNYSEVKEEENVESIKN